MQQTIAEVYEDDDAGFIKSSGGYAEVLFMTSYHLMALVKTLHHYYATQLCPKRASFIDKNLFSPVYTIESRLTPTVQPTHTLYSLHAPLCTQLLCVLCRLGDFCLVRLRQ